MSGQNNQWQASTYGAGMPPAPQPVYAQGQQPRQPHRQPPPSQAPQTAPNMATSYLPTPSMPPPALTQRDSRLPMGQVRRTPPLGHQAPPPPYGLQAPTPVMPHMGPETPVQNQYQRSAPLPRQAAPTSAPPPASSVPSRFSQNYNQSVRAAPPPQSSATLANVFGNMNLGPTSQPIQLQPGLPPQSNSPAPGMPAMPPGQQPPPQQSNYPPTTAATSQPMSQPPAVSAPSQLPQFLRENHGDWLRNAVESRETALPAYSRYQAGIHFAGSAPMPPVEPGYRWEGPRLVGSGGFEEPNGYDNPNYRIPSDYTAGIGGSFLDVYTKGFGRSGANANVPRFRGLIDATQEAEMAVRQVDEYNARHSVPVRCTKEAMQAQKLKRQASLAAHQSEVEPWRRLWENPLAPKDGDNQKLKHSLDRFCCLEVEIVRLKSEIQLLDHLIEAATSKETGQDLHYDEVVRILVLAFEIMPSANLSSKFPPADGSVIKEQTILPFSIKTPTYSKNVRADRPNRKMVSRWLGTEATSETAVVQLQDLIKLGYPNSIPTLKANDYFEIKANSVVLRSVPLAGTLTMDSLVVRKTSTEIALQVGSYMGLWQRWVPLVEYFFVNSTSGREWIARNQRLGAMVQDSGIREWQKRNRPGNNTMTVREFMRTGMAYY